MTQPLSDGWLIIAPADAGTLALLVRAGAMGFRHRRNLTAREADLLMAVEQAAYAARRSVAGTTTVPLPPIPATSSLTVIEAAQALRVSDSFVRRLCRTGVLTAERRGTEWQINADSVATYALARGEAA